MTNHLRKNGLFICIGIVSLLPLAVFPKVPERGIQSRTNLHVVVTGLKQVAGIKQALPVVGAMVLVTSQAANHGFEETAPTDAQGIAIFSDVPHGTVTVQITASGWVTYGGPHQLNKRDQTINIQLQEAAGTTPSPTPTPAPDF